VKLKKRKRVKSEEEQEPVASKAETEEPKQTDEVLRAETTFVVRRDKRTGEKKKITVEDTVSAIIGSEWVKQLIRDHLESGKPANTLYAEYLLPDQSDNLDDMESISIHLKTPVGLQVKFSGGKTTPLPGHHSSGPSLPMTTGKLSVKEVAVRILKVLTATPRGKRWLSKKAGFDYMEHRAILAVLLPKLEESGKMVSVVGEDEKTRWRTVSK
jgi:hypothetical protein